MITDEAVKIVATELFSPQLALVEMLHADARPSYIEAIHRHVRLALELASLQSPPRPPYSGARVAAAPDPKDGDERVEKWGSGFAGSATECMTLRYSAEDDEWLVVGECRVDPYDGNAAVRYDQKTEEPKTLMVPVCDAIGGHVGWRKWDEWSTWEIIPAETVGSLTKA